MNRMLDIVVTNAHKLQHWLFCNARAVVYYKTVPHEYALRLSDIIQPKTTKVTNGSGSPQAQLCTDRQKAKYM